MSSDIDRLVSALHAHRVGGSSYDQTPSRRHPSPDLTRTPPSGKRYTLRGRIYLAFGELANRVALIVGSPWAFTVAVLTIVGWAVTGPAFGYSDTWQLIINTGTTIVTFLIVFLIQHTQNKDARAIQIKLNEVLAAVQGASNRLIDVEKMSDAELDHLQQQFQTLADRMRAQGDTVQAHSIEEENGVGGRARSAI